MFVTMDTVGYAAMCPAGSEGKTLDVSVARPVVHTFVAYPKDGDWYALSPEMDVTKSDLEIFQLGTELPARMTQTFTLKQAPFVAGKTLTNAGAFSFEEPWLSGPIASQTMKNVSANGVLSEAGGLSDDAAQYTCTDVK
jgi:hypothetical protein